MQRQRVADALVPGVDLILLVLVIPCAALLWAVRRLGLQRLSLCRRMLIRLRLLPIRHHYYRALHHPVRSALPARSQAAVARSRLE